MHTAEVCRLFHLKASTQTGARLPPSGASGSLRYQPHSDSRDLQLNVGSSWSAAQTGVAALWSGENASGLESYGAVSNPAIRLEIELGCGLAR